MKNFFVRLVALMGVVILLSSLFACSKNNNKQESCLNFSAMSQEERKKYVNDYLIEKYDMNCTISDINKRQISAVQNEKDYYCIATYDNFWFSVWITGNEQDIVDTSYTYYLKNDVNSYIEDLLKNKGIDCVAYNRFIFEQKSTFDWDSSKIEEMLLSDNTYNNIHLYGIDKNYEVETISSVLKGMKGAAYIHFEEFNSQNIDFENYDDFIDLD